MIFVSYSSNNSEVEISNFVIPAKETVAKFNNFGMHVILSSEAPEGSP